MKKKVLTLGLAMAMALTAVPALAATDVEGGHDAKTEHEGKGVTAAEVCAQQTIESDETASCSVYAEVGSTFTVTIPKSLTLSGADKTGSYNVAVTGDIAGNQYVSVTPAATFAMEQDGKADVTATITQTVNKFRGDNYTSELLTDGTEVRFATGATGSIAAPDLTAGAWEGTFDFVIALNADEAAVTP